MSAASLGSTLASGLSPGAGLAHRGRRWRPGLCLGQRSGKGGRGGLCIPRGQTQIRQRGPGHGAGPPGPPLPVLAAAEGVGAPAPRSPSMEPQPGPSLGTPGDLAGGFQGRLSTPPTPTPRRSQRHPWHRERPRRPQAQGTPQAEGQLSLGEDGQGWAPGPEPLTQGRERGAHRVLRGPSVAVLRCL